MAQVVKVREQMFEMIIEVAQDYVAKEIKPPLLSILAGIEKVKKLKMFRCCGMRQRTSRMCGSQQAMV